MYPLLPDATETTSVEGSMLLLLELPETTGTFLDSEQYEKEWFTTEEQVVGDCEKLKDGDRVGAVNVWGEVWSGRPDSFLFSACFLPNFEKRGALAISFLSCKNLQNEKNK